LLHAAPKAANHFQLGAGGGFSLSLLLLQPIKAINMKSLVNLGVRAVTAILVGTSFQIWAAEDATTSASENRTQPWEKGAVAFGGFAALFDSDLTFGVSGGGSTSLSSEDLLGLESNLTVFRAGAMYRPGESRRHQLDFSYASFDRDGSATLAEEIQIGNVTYPIGAQIETVFDFDIIRGTYSFAFWQSDRVRLALGAGIYAVPLQYKVDIQTTGGNTVVEGADTTLPLPALALRGEFLLVNKLFLTASVEGMYLEIDNFQGSLVDLNLGMEYRPWKHLGFGLAYNFMSVNVEGESDSSNYPGADFVGEVDVRFSGLFLYGKLSF
jgi:hypothetical protein